MHLLSLISYGEVNYIQVRFDIQFISIQCMFLFLLTPVNYFDVRQLSCCDIRQFDLRPFML